MDAPEHTLVRRMLTAEFTVKRAESLRPAITVMVDELLDAFLALEQPADLVEHFAVPLVTNVICAILGVPYEDHEFFQARGAILNSKQTSLEESARVNRELLDYVHSLAAVKAETPGDDVVSRLLERERRGELSRGELVNIAKFLLIAALENTAAMIELGVVYLTQYPAQMATLAQSEDPRLLANAIEELLRISSVATGGRRRIATEDIEVGGYLIRAGEGVIASSEAGNRDPEVFDDPDRLDIHRANVRQHVAFGYGPHQCLGQQLARVELSVVFRALLDRAPNLALAQTVTGLPFRYDMRTYGTFALPVRW